MRILKGTELKKGIGLRVYTPQDITNAQKEYSKLGVDNVPSIDSSITGYDKQES